MERLDFSTAFKYPFNRWKGLLNILWFLIPIFGWFAIMGYKVRLVREWVDGKFQELPLFKFWDDFKLGFMIFLKFIPLMIVIGILNWILGRSGWLGVMLFIAISLLIVPMLGINLIVKGTVAAGFELEKVNPVFDNIGDYLMVLLLDIGLSIVFWVMSIILVGIPAAAFTKNIFLSDFYRRNVK